MTSLTLRKLKNTTFYELYKKLLFSSEVTKHEIYALFKIAVILINVDNEVLQLLGYRIIVLYCNQYNDYIPLYDVSINKGLIPISKFIEGLPSFNDISEDKFFRVFNSSFLENYKSGEIYLTEQQKKLGFDFIECKSNSIVVVAPTSYGKSELFSSFCRSVLDSNICLIVPTKALLAQSKRRLLKKLNVDDKRKVITHPDMYQDNSEKFIGVLTQERLLRLLQKNKHLSFDYVFVDEAHNLLEKEQRATLLLQTIILLEKRSKNTAFKFLTPFVVDTSNLKPRYIGSNILPYKINEKIKTEKYFLVDFRDKKNEDCISLQFYDHFFNKYEKIYGKEFLNETELLEKEGGEKNIIYFNSPPKIEEFSLSFASNRPKSDDESINKICKEIAGFIHGDFKLIECLKKGIVYHHGSVPDIVKLYIEDVFSSNDKIKYIVTSSTLLEGVNIPAERLFVFQPEKGRGNLSPSQFKNLVGRVCRFSEIFNRDLGSLSRLEPNIYIVGSRYCSSRSNLKDFLRNCTKVDKDIFDKPENVLLEKVEITDSNVDEKLQADSVLENLEKGITGLTASYAETTIGRMCFVNSISEIDVLRHEIEMSTLIEDIEKKSIKNTRTLMYCIANVFVPFLRVSEWKLKRLEKISTQNFYSMFIGWRTRNASYGEMISSFLGYWAKVANPIVYVGKWGDITSGDLGSFRKHYVHIKSKTIKEQVNLAIVRIKEEQDFVDTFIIKFVEVLNELELVEDELYLNIKYGTNNRKKITLINNGINNHLATVLLEKYPEYMSIDVDSNTVEIDRVIVDRMKENGENDILIFETGFHIR
jgi:hypothetical protein